VWQIVSEQGLTSPPTQYRLSGRQFYRSKDPTNSFNVLKEKNKTSLLQSPHMSLGQETRSAYSAVPETTRACMAKSSCVLSFALYLKLTVPQILSTILSGPHLQTSKFQKLKIRQNVLHATLTHNM